MRKASHNASSHARRNMPKTSRLARGSLSIKAHIIADFARNHTGTCNAYARKPANEIKKSSLLARRTVVIHPTSSIHTRNSSKPRATSRAAKLAQNTARIVRTPLKNTHYPPSEPRNITARGTSSPKSPMTLHRPITSTSIETSHSENHPGLPHASRRVKLHSSQGVIPRKYKTTECSCISL